MITASLAYVRDLLHAQFCYQVFITPIHYPIEKPYRNFAKMACEFFEDKRTEMIHEEYPRHHVLHHFVPTHKIKNKKILIAHGWMSRAAYMIRLINALCQEGYEVYAIDFPAHGEAKGLQLPWIDAVAIVRETLNDFGPFYGVIGHSFGGAMLLNTLNIAGQLPEWGLTHKPEKAVLIASPTKMRGPVNQVAKKLKLNGTSYQQLKQLIEQQGRVHLSTIRLQHFVMQMPNIPILCIHGDLDKTVHPQESVTFCEKYQQGKLCILPNADHVSVLMDERVEEAVHLFLESERSF